MVLKNIRSFCGKLEMIKKKGSGKIVLATYTKENLDIYEESDDYDGLWKRIIRKLFEEFILLVAPQLYEEIDFTHKSELQQ